MSVKCREIMNYMEELAPKSLAESWDNVGLMIGDADAEINTVLVCLDITDKVVKEAVEKKADLIVTHHPFIFKGVKNITAQTAAGRRIITLIQNNISVYSAHTNLDVAYGGTNSVLAHALELKNIQGLMPTDTEGEYMGRVGELAQPMTFYTFSLIVKEILNAEYITVTGNEMTVVSKVALCTGKGSSYDFMAKAKEMGCQAYITGDMGYHEGQTANDLELCVIDGTHYLTEVLVVPALKDYIEGKFSELNVIKSNVDAQTLRII